MKELEVLIITYNQQNLVSRALDSILSQAEFGLKDIIICDDCSTDNNWLVISDYSRRYPQYVKAYRNEQNLGIYGNMNHLVSLRGTADLYFIMSGDDAMGEGVFCALQSFIEDIPLDNVFASFFCDWIRKHVDGKEYLFRNNLADKGMNNVSLKLRGLLSSRSVFVTKAVMDKYTPVDLSHGVAYAEEMYDIRPHLLSDKFYYFPFIGSIYYSGIGVSTNFDKMRQYRKSDLYKWEQTLSWPQLSRKDRFYVKSQIYVDQMYEKESFRFFFPALWFFLRGIVPAYGYRPLTVARDWFGVAKWYFKYKRQSRKDKK